jgi:hypothetical protein
MATTPLTAAQMAQVRYYAGYTAFGAFGYVLSPGMALLDTQVAAMSDAEQALLISNFLNVLPGLETAINSMSGTLGVASAGPFQRNENEQAERNKLFNSLRRRMCAWIGCEPGPLLEGIGGMGSYCVTPT